MVESSVGGRMDFKGLVAGKDYNIAEESPKAVIIEVLNSRTAEMLGASTWCIKSESVWQEWVNRGVKFYFIFNLGTKSFANRVWAIAYSPELQTKDSNYIEVYDGGNRQITACSFDTYRKSMELRLSFIPNIRQFLKDKCQRELNMSGFNR